VSEYDRFAAHYDALMGDREEIARDIRKLLRLHNPKAQTILELGCGTGSMLKHFQRTHDVTGVDLSASMLRIARAKVPGVKLYRQNIAKLKVPGRFDVVLCLFDTMNHLTGFDQWKSVFKRVRSKLSDGGVFIFDINTVHALKLYAARPAYAEIDKNGINIYEVFHDGGDRYHLELRLLKKVGPRRFELFQTNIPEIAVPTEKIAAELKGHFRSITLFDAERKRATKKTEELYFICKL